MSASAEAWETLRSARLYDLSHSLDHKLPVSPNHPGFRMALHRRHGDMVRADGGSAASEMIVMGGHTGTHIDALCHVSHNGKLFGGVDAAEAQRGGAFSALGVETIPILFCRGVLLDIPGLLGIEVLPAGMAITEGHLKQAAERQHVTVREGDAVLVRSGWPIYWADPPRFVGLRDGAPGPDESAARWIAGRAALVTGAETIAYECIRSGLGHSLLPVHRILLVENGIYIIEGLNLTELARDKVWEFLFVATPLRITGATGIPVRPVAVVR